MNKHVDLNSDLGESFGSYTMGMDERILELISSANIACGFHAGDPDVMHKTVQLALKNGVAIGAHPGFPDLVGFGRRTMATSPQEVYTMMVYQIGALNGFIKAEGGRMQHVKPHGALYNMAAKDKKLAEAIVESLYKVDPELVLFGLAGSEMIHAAKRIGIRAVEEVFADRTYQKDGSLTPRSQANSMISDDGLAIAQVLKMVQEKKVTSVDGDDISLQADTICVHGDGEHAILFAKKIKEKLEEANILVKSIR